MSSVLIVDDEHSLLRALAMNLVARGYTVTEADTGTKALTAVAGETYDAIVLDLGLPDISGLDVIRAVREFATTPIIVLSARTSSSDKVQALDLGADDYVSKPFSMEELLARLRATTRRASTVDAAQTVTVGQTQIDLAAKRHLLETLLRQPGKLVTGRTLLTELRGAPEHTDPSYLRIYMAQLRRKLEPEPSRPRHLITEPGMGYRFQP